MLAKKFAIKEFFPKDFCNRDEATAQITVGTQSKKALVEKLKRKFTDEARALCRLSHPGIVSVTDVFEENGTAYFVMDYVEGRSLSDMLKIEGPMSEARAVGYIRQIALALQYVHNNNRLHLDVKPANIMVDKNDHAVLIDFGASKQYDEESGENTSTIMGKTPGYAPIEQMGNNVQKFAPATDIYALGATLYKLLTGVTPPSSADLAGGEELMPLPPSVSKGVKYAIAEAMEIRITKRPQSMAAFLALLNPEKSVSDDENTIVEDEKTQIVDSGNIAPIPPVPPVPPMNTGDQKSDLSDKSDWSDKQQTNGNKPTQPRKKLPWKLITFSAIGLAAIISLALIFAGGEEEKTIAHELQPLDNAIATHNIETVRIYAEQGDSLAQDFMGDVYRWGINGKSTDGRVYDITDTLSIAEDWYKKAVAHGNTESAYKLGCINLIKGGDSFQRKDEAIKYLRIAAEAGNLDARYLLGLWLLRSGEGAEGYDWMLRSHKYGNLKATYQLAAGCYEDMPSEIVTEARDKLKRLAEAGDAQACGLLAQLYLNNYYYSDSGNQLLKAREWAQKGYRQNDATSAWVSGQTYQRTGDISTAQKYYQKASEWGDITAMIDCNLAEYANRRFESLWKGDAVLDDFVGVNINLLNYKSDSDRETWERRAREYDIRIN